MQKVRIHYGKGGTYESDMHHTMTNSNTMGTIMKGTITAISTKDPTTTGVYCNACTNFNIK